MANVIRLKRASGSDPAASDLVSGEPAVRTDTGELFFKKDDGSIAKVAGAGGGPDFKYLALRNAANNGAASFPNADFTLVTSGTTSAITPTAANTLLVSVNGVIQKPNTGTSTPSQGFALSGSTIKFGANISAAPDFILYQESGGIGEPSDDTVSEVKLKVSNSPVNGYFLSAQSGNNGGLTWAAPVATSCTGNSATATALETARTINGTSFDGTANITVTAAAGTLTGNTLNSSVTASSLTSLGDLSGLTVTGNLAVDTSTLFVNASTNRVGIGTTSPSSPLEVSSATNPVIKATSSSSSVGAAFNAQGGSSNDSQLILSSGTTAKYTILRDGSQSDDLRIYDSVNALDIIRYRHGSYLHFGVNGSERMRIDSSGRVLIGHSSSLSIGSGDSVALQVSSTSAPVFGGVRYVNTNSGPFLNLAKSRATSAGSNTIVQANDDLGTIIFAGDDGTDLISKGAQISAAVDGTPGSNDMPGRLVFSTTADGAAFSTERMRIDSSGNVGIGTASPAYTNALFGGSQRTFHLSGTAAPQLRIQSSTSGQADLLLQAGNSGSTAYIANAASGGDLFFSTNNGGSQGTRFAIKDDGKVGIGTTSPNADVDIATSVEDSTGTLSAHGIRLFHVGATDEEVIPITGGFLSQVDRARAGIGFISQISGSSEGYGGAVGFYTRNTADGNGLLRSDERMRIDSSGRLLQGKSTTKGSTGEVVPTFCTEIASNSSPNVFEIANNGTNANNSYSALVLSRSDSTSVNGHTAVDSGDQIGEVCFIGADGSDRFNTAAAIKAFANSDFTANDCPANLTFHTNGGSATASERMRITSSGDVLVATTSASIFNDTSGGGFVVKADGQLLIKKEATSVADPLVWLNDTGQTTNKFIVFAQDGSEKANIGLAGNDATITVAGSESMRIDSSGYVTKPRNLCLQYTPSSSQNVTTGTVIYATEVFDVGNSDAYNTTSGEFTAPVTGVYRIQYEHFAAGTGRATAAIQKYNGSSWSTVKNGMRVYASSSTGGNWPSVPTIFYLQLDVNEKFKIIHLEGTIHLNTPWNHLTVQLVQ